MQVIGGTKTGKTFFLEQLARQLMALPKNRSVIVLDPHGSLYYRLMDYCILAACFRRPRKEREANPAYLILDEFQHFTTKDICVILNEGRKFGLHLILAHHHLGPIKERDPEVYYSVLTNATTKVVFGGISEEDATTFARQLFRFNLDERKLELYAPYDRPELEWVDIVTEHEGAAWHSGVASAISSGEAYRPDTGFFGDELMGLTAGKSSHDTSGEGGSRGTSVSHVPLTTYVHEERLSSVQFRQLDEQVRRAEEALMDQPTQHALIKIRGKPVTFFKVPTLKTLRVRDSERREYKDRILDSAPYYATLEEVKAERQERQKKLGLTPATSTPNAASSIDIPRSSDDDAEPESYWQEAPETL